MAAPLSSTSRAPHWKALIFCAGANDLGPSMARSLEQLAEDGVPKNVDVFVQSYDAEGQAVRYRLKPGPDEAAVAFELQSVPANSGVASGLESFLAYAEQQAPNASTLLVLGGHGEGHRGSMIDEKHQDRLDLPEMEAAMSAHPVQTVLFDSCLMSSWEVAHCLGGEAEVMVASEDVVRSGTALADYLKAASASSDAQDLGQRLVEGRAAGFSSLTAVSTEKLQEVAPQLSRFSTELLKLPVETLRDVYESTRRGLSSQGNVLLGYYTYPGDRIDAGDFCRNLVARTDLQPALKNSAEQLLSSLQHCTIAHSTRDPKDRSTGLTLSLPLYRAGEEAPREEVALWRETGWDKVIEAFQVQDQKKAQPPSLSSLFAPK